MGRVFSTQISEEKHISLKVLSGSLKERDRFRDQGMEGNVKKWTLKNKLQVCVYWIHSPQCTTLWQGPVNTVMHLGVPSNVGIF